MDMLIITIFVTQPLVIAFLWWLPNPINQSINQPLLLQVRKESVPGWAWGLGLVRDVQASYTYIVTTDRQH